MRTKITLGTSGDIDLYEDISVPLNYSIGDVRKPDTRQGSYSKTITIPGSKNNDRLFQYIFEIDIDCRFNPNKRAECIVYIDGIEQIRGYLRLVRIKTNDDNKIEYDCTILGNISNIFTVLGNNELTQLDLSEFNHTYSKTVQKASWIATPGSGYVYPMIDYGYTNWLTYDVTNFYPAVYAKTYIDKIFQYAGATYSSTFFDSALFKRLIVPLNSNKLSLSSSQIAARLFSSSLSTSGTIALPTTAFSGAIITFPFDTDVSDPSSQFNTSTYTFTAAYPGSYNFTTSFKIQLNNTFGGTTPNGWVSIKKRRAGVVSTLASNVLTSYTGAVTTTQATITLSTGTPADLLPGDEVYVELWILTQAVNTPNVNYSNGTFSNTVNNVGVFDGDTINMTLAIPEKVKMKDFLMAFVKMFNLYIETDKDNSNKYYIETRNSFYDNGRVRDWTSKWDISQDLVQEPMGELDAKRFIFKYTDDKDYYNDLYLKTWGETYGTKTIDVDNEFIVGDKKTDIIFSPTPLVNNGSSDRTIPAIFSTDSSGNITPKQSNIRILYYGGVKTTANSWTYTGSVSGTSTETTYPYAGHLDDVSSPTIDLSFGVPFQVYYSALVYTDNNLYNAYYKQFLEEITDKDSKVVTGWFYLTPKDILLLDFRDTYFIDGHFLRLNKVFDYNPVVSQLTKCEFIKIKAGQSFVSHQAYVTGSATDVFVAGGDNVPVPIGTNPPRNGNGGGGGNMKSPGSITDPSVEGVIVTGTRNYVGTGCTNVALLNCSGVTVMPGVHGATLINTSGVTINESDVLYVGGQRFSMSPAKTLALTASQSGVSAPTTGYQSINGIGGFTWGYSSAGVYTMTFDSGTFPDSSKVFITIGSTAPSPSYDIRGRWTSDSTITIYTFQSGAAANNALSNTFINITVYS